MKEVEERRGKEERRGNRVQPVPILMPRCFILFSFLFRPRSALPVANCFPDVSLGHWLWRRFMANTCII